MQSKGFQQTRKNNENGIQRSFCTDGLRSTMTAGADRQGGSLFSDKGKSGYAEKQEKTLDMLIKTAANISGPKAR